MVQTFAKVDGRQETPKIRSAIPGIAGTTETTGPGWRGNSFTVYKIRFRTQM